MPTLTIALWAGLLILAALGPGPCLVMSLRAGLASGPRAMVETGIGFGLSAFTWTLAALFGFAALLSAYPLACSLISKIGGGLVAVVGVSMVLLLALRGPRRYSVALEDESPSRRGDSARRMMGAFGVHAISPGTVLFFIGVTPIVLANGCSAETHVSVVLAVSLAAIAASIYIAAHFVLSRGIVRLREFLNTRKRLVAFELIAAITMIGAGVVICA